MIIHTQVIFSLQSPDYDIKQLAIKGNYEHVCHISFVCKTNKGRHREGEVVRYAAKHRNTTKAAKPR